MEMNSSYPISVPRRMFASNKGIQTFSTELLQGLLRGKNSEGQREEGKTRGRGLGPEMERKGEKKRG